MRLERLKSCLPKELHELAEAADGASGVALFSSFAPAVTFLDLTMSGMDGAQALKEMKQIRSNTVIIILTADIQKRTIEMVSECGAFAVLKKPPPETGSTQCPGTGAASGRGYPWMTPVYC